MHQISILVLYVLFKWVPILFCFVYHSLIHLDVYHVITLGAEINVGSYKRWWKFCISCPCFCFLVYLFMFISIIRGWEELIFALLVIYYRGSLSN
ncbi:hypothetical protein QJS04_geneDACA023912 [Acorus gramineus]|uniref:Uncharacterized protein n=1 Tax=Acorus gramineus TaxID=55184 RepID=A0AAV9ALD7_ACOGR|nr:hypothetical protein QJS04_geneDACA023912 [Acorus gramineus]